VDARGLSCPMPIVKTATLVRTLASGKVIEVLATDPGSVKDFAAWSKVTGNEIVQTAIELLRADYTAHKNDSTLIRVLVKREVLEESGGGAGREAEAA